MRAELRAGIGALPAIFDSTTHEKKKKINPPKTIIEIGQNPDQFLIYRSGKKIDDEEIKLLDFTHYLFLFSVLFVLRFD